MLMKDPLLAAEGDWIADHAVSELLHDHASQSVKGGRASESKTDGRERHAEQINAELMRLLELLEPFISIGRLSSGLAHNLNGYLTGLIGHLELLKMKRPDLSLDLDTVLGLARKLRDGISEISGKLDNELTREPQPQNINQILRAELAFLKADLFFKHSVNVELNLSEPLPNVYGAYADFSLALENALMNAIDAQRNAKSAWIRVRTYAEGDRILVEIEDGGPGFSAEALGQDFDQLRPETRVDVEGIVRGGVGLTLSRLRLERWGGKMCLSNSAGRGAAIQVSLPKREKLPSK